MSHAALLGFSALASIATGVLGAFFVSIASARTRLGRNPGARFVLWFALLLLTAAAVPFTGATALVRLGTQAVTHTVVQHPRYESASTIRSRTVTPSVFMRTVAAAKPGAPRRSTRSDVLLRWCIAVWAAGCAFMLLRALAGLVRLRSIVARSEFLEPRVTRRGRVMLRSTKDFDAPVAAGYFRPSILLPRALIATQDVGDLENVVLHELAHLARFDDVNTLVQCLCVALLWWNPLVHVIAARLDSEREMACDDLVVMQTGRRKSYAVTLWRVGLGDSNAPALTPGFGARSDIVARFSNLLDGASAQKLHPARIASAVIALAVVSATCAIAVPALALPSMPIADSSSATLGKETLLVGGRRLDGSPVDDVVLLGQREQREAVLHLRIARWSATLTKLANGDVLITGGMTAAGATSDAAIYDHERRRLIQIAPMRFARAGQTATLLAGGDVVIAGGERSPQAFVPQTEIYHAASARFQYVADGAGRISQAALPIGQDRVLMVGSSKTHCAIIFDARRNAYKNAGTFLFARGSSLVFRQRSGRIVVFTSADADASIASQ